jgi:hypothetical protein
MSFEVYERERRGRRRSLPYFTCGNCKKKFDEFERYGTGKHLCKPCNTQVTYVHAQKVRVKRMGAVAYRAWLERRRENLELAELALKTVTG